MAHKLMLLLESLQLVFFMVGWNVRLKDKPGLTPNQAYNLREVGKLLVLVYREKSERRS